MKILYLTTYKLDCDCSLDKNNNIDINPDCKEHGGNWKDQETKVFNYIYTVKRIKQEGGIRKCV